jgi:hypothetical protein
VTLYSNWEYVLIEAGPAQAGIWRHDDHCKGVLPDLISPADRSWLVSTLWDDHWTCIGGPRALVDAFLAHPDLRRRAREVDPSSRTRLRPARSDLIDGLTLRRVLRRVAAAWRVSPWHAGAGLLLFGRVVVTRH